MPLTRVQKEKVVEQAGQDLAAAASVVFVAHDGLTLAQMKELRARLQAEGGNMRVIPKRLLRLVLQQAKWDFDPVAPEGQLAVAWGGDAVAPAKALHEFAKKHDGLKLLAGVLEGNMLSMQEVTSLAQLPSRQQLLGQLVGVLAGPARGLVAVLSGVQRQAIYVLVAIKDNKL